MLSRRRWQSIDRKLPLMASGLVLGTVATLGFVAYLLFEHALVTRAEGRLVTSARGVGMVITRPNVQLRDTLGKPLDDMLVGFLQKRIPYARAREAVFKTLNPRDTMKFHTAVLDIAGNALIDVHKGSSPEPEWAVAAIRRHALRGDRVVIGPIENINGSPAVSAAYALRDARDSVVGYVTSSWLIASGRTARLIRQMIGTGVTMVLGQPDTGSWTDLESVVPAPPKRALADSIVDAEGTISASWPVAGTGWVVFLSQPRSEILAPTRTLLWTMIPLGLIIALVGAALMMRIALRITHPIVQLTAAVEQIAKDSQLVRSDELPSASLLDEVARLRVAFERMALRITDREALELQLRHAQKMEAVGRLAGGIAHDFNNLLTAIRSYADLMIEDMPQWDSKRGDVEEIRKAAHRASALTAQLLAFSRKQMLQPKVLDTAAVLGDVHTMLRRLLIEDIELVHSVPEDLWAVRADRGQLEQVIVNLAVNARDAMPRGGVLRIGAENVTLDRAIETHHGPLPVGEYVAIAVSDTGVGMDEATQARVFEPFFTTKAMGKGTGLGLATVHGIVAQSGGHITLDSRVDGGTCFTVYLPRERAKPRDSGATAARPMGGDETVLLVEDEAAVRALAKRVLSRAGYRVVEAPTPSDALELAREHAEKIRLVVSDVVMPEMSGPVLVERIRQLCPNARVLFISGYSDDEVLGRGLATAGMELLQKPFSAQQLVERVRATLDAVPA